MPLPVGVDDRGGDRAMLRQEADGAAGLVDPLHADHKLRSAFNHLCGVEDRASRGARNSGPISTSTVCHYWSQFLAIGWPVKFWPRSLVPTICGLPL